MRFFRAVLHLFYLGDTYTQQYIYIDSENEKMRKRNLHVNDLIIVWSGSIFFIKSTGRSVLVGTEIRDWNEF